jgi:molybdopterin-dependent oxidoreductase alpha subunit
MSRRPATRPFRSLMHGLAPFGITQRKPRHFVEMVKVAWRNRDNLRYAWRVLTRGVCDGCALGTTGLRDWTLDGTHLCLVRLNLLRLNTMRPFDPVLLEDAAALRRKSSRELRDLGRLGWPVRRRKGERGFTQVTWDEVWTDVGARWRRTDPARTAMFVTSRGVTNEVYYVAQKVMRWLGSNSVDNSARLCHAPSTVGLKSSIGSAATTCSYRDWYETDLIVFLGSNPANDQPVAMKYLDEARRRGTRVINVNACREPGMERYWVPSTPSSALFGTRMSDRHLLVKVGGDLALLTAAAKLLVERDGGARLAREFIATATTGFEAYRAQLANESIADLAAQAGLTVAEIEAFADELLGSDRAILVWSMGITHHVDGADTVKAIVNLALLREWIGREGCGLMPIRGHSGVQGGAEMGAYSSAFPGGLPINAENARHFSRLWGFDVPETPGLATPDFLAAAGRGELDAFWCIGGNLLETMPDPATIRAALSRIPLRVHTDLVLTSQMLVDPEEVVYVLPSRTRYEQRGGGTETSTERRVIFSPEIPRGDLGEARSEWELLLDLARATDPQRFAAVDFVDGAAIRADIERAVPLYRGIAALAKQGDQFQYGGPHYPSGRRFPTPDGRARFQCVRPHAPIPVARPLGAALEAPTFRLATRRGKQFNSMVQADIDPLTGAARDHVFIAPVDAARLGLRADEPIVVTSATGQFRGRVFLAEVAPGTVQGHWPEVNVLLADGLLEPSSRVPDYNADVTIERARQAP